MFPSSRPRLAMHRRFLAALIAVGLLAAACGASAPASFAPTGACDGDGRAPGTYPELEALLPDVYEGEQPDSVDSGRTCTPAGLAVLAGAGVTDVRFAGATWDMGLGKALTAAVFEGDNVTARSMIDFYEDGARRARRTQELAATDTTVAGRPARRLDVLWGESAQTIVAWPDASGDRVNVLLTADLGDAKVLEALDLFAGR